MLKCIPEFLSQQQWGPTSHGRGTTTFEGVAPLATPPAEPPSPVTTQELTNVIKDLKHNKAPGQDRLTGESLKMLDIARLRSRSRIA